MPLPLNAVVEALREIAPPLWAEEWDNVGLLVDPPGRARVARVLLAIDATAAVLGEARLRRADLIVAYHPPLFTPLRRLRRDVPGELVVMQCVQWRIAVYSPHTALDAATGGVCDWLASALGPGERRPLLRGPQHDGAPPDVGQGREVVLAGAVSVRALARRISRHFGGVRLRTALTAAHRAGAPVQRVLLCPGAGGAVLAGRAADVLLTGEMRHHDVLAALARGTSVVLSEHTHTERGYLPSLAQRLRRRLGPAVAVALARADREPLQ